VRRRRRTGFTLLELTLSSVLLSLVMVTAWRVLIQARRVARLASTAFDQDRERLIRLRRLEATLRTPAPYLQTDEDLDFLGSPEDLRFVALEYRTAGKPGRPALIHLGEDGEGVFLEIQTVGFLQTDSQRRQGSEVKRFPEFRDLALSYFDGEKWKDDWGFRRLNRLPRALRIRLQATRETPAGGVIAEPIELIVPLVMERDMAIR
jgi:hypothetical protein